MALTKPKGFRGEFLLHDDPAYDKFRHPWNEDHAHIKPSAVLLPHGAHDVQVAIKWIKENKLEFTVMSGGHSISGKSLKDGAVLIRLTRMNHVHVDPKERTAWVGMGATVKDFDAETNAYHLCGVGGHVSHTGMGGFCLHGGYGCISRRYGLAVDNMLAARVVLADGSLVEASAEENQDLFFAVRGAGSMLGVVTELKVQLFPLPKGDLIYSGQAFWVAELDEELQERLQTWAKIVTNAHPHVNCLGLFASPPVPPFEGRRVFAIHACWLGDEPMEKAKQLLDEALAPLFAKEPLINAVGPKPFSVFNSMQDPFGQYGDSVRTTCFHADDGFKTAHAVQSLEKGRPPTAAVIMEAWGGKIDEPGRAPEDDVVHPIRHKFNVFLLASLRVEKFVKPTFEWLAKAKHSAAELGVHVGAYVNYSEDSTKPYGKTTDKLAAIKAKYDPDFMFPPIPGATAAARSCC